MQSKTTSGPSDMPTRAYMLLHSTRFQVAFRVDSGSHFTRVRAIEKLGLRMEHEFPGTTSRLAAGSHLDGPFIAYIEIGDTKRAGGPFEFHLIAEVVSCAVFVRSPGARLLDSISNRSWRLDWLYTSTGPLWPLTCWPTWTAMFGEFEIEGRNIESFRSCFPNPSDSLVRTDGDRLFAKMERPHPMDKQGMKLSKMRGNVA